MPANANRSSWPRIAVFGAGAVGGYYGGMLALAGAPVTLIGRAQHVAAIERDGLVIERAERREVIAVRASTQPEAVADADVVLLCVKSPDTRAAAASLRPHLQRDAIVVSLQNGVENAAWAATEVDQLVLAAVVWVGAYMAGPGVVRHTGRGDLDLGVPRACAAYPEAAARAQAVATMFERAGVKCPVSADIEAALWSKLTINCAFNAISALGRARYGRMAATPLVRDLMEDLVHETLAVARADGVHLDDAAMIATTWHVAKQMAAQYSSTAQDVLRGKPTEIDMLNGYVAERAQALGLAAPLSRTLHALVKLREAGDDLVA
ncbi:MAG: 2-dehydropantoate 2-reductase [Burkholderiales bacterium]|nr:2-dehydropantoate 2-reductase [Burkholderiales bacterium]